MLKFVMEMWFKLRDPITSPQLDDVEHTKWFVFGVQLVAQVYVATIVSGSRKA